jgi:hypothetical protein
LFNGNPPLAALEPAEEFDNGLGGGPVLTDYAEKEGLCEC